jgi:prepilin-type processing-associated H-X9-DG protein/prepilin-type N-terminal cleavage/methylation domain-containing protein
MDSCESLFAFFHKSPVIINNKKEMAMQKTINGTGSIGVRERCFFVRKRFTLIELLVVIAIIAVLASMLLPALNKAMEEARRISCMNNQKTFGIVMNNYLDDNDGAFPLATWCWRSMKRDHWIHAFYLNKYIQEPNWGAGSQANTHIDTKKSSIWVCPTPQADGTFGVQSAVTVQGSAFFHSYWGLRSEASTNYSLFITSVKSSSSTSMFSCVGVTGATYPYSLMYAYGSPSVKTQLLQGILTRHSGKRANYTFIDGHVASRTINQITNNYENMFFSDFRL